MSQETISVTVNLAGCDYRFVCPLTEREELLEAGRHLDLKMREIRDHSSKVLTLEAIAVMAAMNLSHELLRQQRQVIETDAVINNRVQDLLQKVDVTLNQVASMEL